MSPGKIITMSSLGKNGRFGNQFFQYSFLKCLAKANDYSVEIPDWSGRKIFQAPDPEISIKLPRIYELSNDINKSLLLKSNSQIFNCDVWGWFQFHTSYYQQYQGYIRTLFTPKDSFSNKGNLILRQLLKNGNTLVTIHLRRGDADSKGPYYYAPTTWYLDWLSSIWSRLEKPVLYIASDDSNSVVPDFKEYNPYCLSDFCIDNDHSWFFDFFIMQNSSRLAISNSTFSFAASMLNENSTVFFRPCKESSRLVEYDPWNSDPVLNNIYEPNIEIFEQVNNLSGGKINVHAQDDELRAIRRKVIDIWLSTSEYELEPLYHAGFGIAYRSLLDAPVQPDTSEYEMKSCLMEKVNSGMQQVWFMQYLLSAMLLCEPEEFTFQNDLLLLPEWFIADYIKYLQRPFRKLSFL